MKKNPIQPKRKRTRNPRATGPKPARRQTTYVNHVDSQWGTCEIQLALSETKLTGVTPPTVEVSEVARVALPIQTAKVLAFQLICNIAAYETLFGAVNMAPAFVPQMPTAPIFGPEVIARLGVLHSELFAPVPPASPAPVNSESRGIKDEDPDTEWPITKH